MWYSYGFQALVARLVHKLLGKAVDSVAPADPLSADYQVPDEPLDNGPEFDARSVSADLDLAKLGIWVAACDERWDRGFRDSQREVIVNRAARAGKGAMLNFQVFHQGVATGLEIALERHSVSKVRMVVAGRGPAIDVAIEELRKVADAVAEFRADGEPLRDGRFQREGDCWIGELPPGEGRFFGQPLRVEVEASRAGLPGAGQIGELPLLARIRQQLPKLLARAESELRKEVACSPSELESVRNPRIRLGAGEGAERWSLVADRRDWPGFLWRLEFDGLELLGLRSDP